MSFDVRGAFKIKKWEKLVFWTNQGEGGSDRIPTFWQNFPKLNLPCKWP